MEENSKHQRIDKLIESGEYESIFFPHNTEMLLEHYDWLKSSKEQINKKEFIYQLQSDIRFAKEFIEKIEIEVSTKLRIELSKKESLIYEYAELEIMISNAKKELKKLNAPVISDAEREYNKISVAIDSNKPKNNNEQFCEDNLDKFLILKDEQKKEIVRFNKNAEQPDTRRANARFNACLEFAKGDIFEMVEKGTKIGKVVEETKAKTKIKISREFIGATFYSRWNHPENNLYNDQKTVEKVYRYIQDNNIEIKCPKFKEALEKFHAI